MDSVLVDSLKFTALPVAAMILGACIALFRMPGPRVGSSIQHFAAGMVFAAAAVELLPELISKHDPLATIVGFAIGIVLMLFIRTITERVEKRSTNPTSRSLGLIAIIGVDILIDGLLMGISFLTGEKQGILLTIALTLELLSLGLATLVALRSNGSTSGKSLMIILGLACLPFLGALVGGTVLAGLPGGGMDGLLAFGVAALLYLVTEELLVEAHKAPDGPWITSLFFVGFLLLLTASLLL